MHQSLLLISGLLHSCLRKLKNFPGNPSALHKEGVAARHEINEARKTIAGMLNVKSEEIIFTSGGTEADNLALRGIAEAWKPHIPRPHIVTTNIEHAGILEVCKYLAKNGTEITYVPVEKNGIVNPQKIKQALKPTTVLVSVMYANNEIGTIQPLREISRIIAEYKKERSEKEKGTALNIPYLHTDASQAGNYLDLNFQKLGIDLMTLDAAKFYGPRGIGLLAVRRLVSINPLIIGGGQERGLRSGTENVSASAGMALALQQAADIKEKETVRLSMLRDYFFAGVIKNIPGVLVNGDVQLRLPNNINICIPGLDAEFAVIKLDARGIACSAASSCLNLSETSYSYVIDALDNAPQQTPFSPRNCKSSALRFTLGRDTTKKDIDLTLRALTAIITTQ